VENEADYEPDSGGPERGFGRNRRGHGYWSVSPLILPASGIMIGVCAILIGLVKIFETHVGPSRVDEHTALCGIFFLISAILSYLSSYGRGRTKNKGKLELLGDTAFVVGLISLVVVAVLFSFEFI